MKPQITRPRPWKLPARLAAGALLFAMWQSSGASSAFAQDPNDAISREFTVYNDLAPSDQTDAVSREFTVYNDLAELAPTDAVSREFTVYNKVLSSNDSGNIALIDESLPCAIAPLSPTCPVDPRWLDCDGFPQWCQDPNCVDDYPPVPSCPGCDILGCEIPDVDELSCELAIVNAGPVPELNLNWQRLLCRTPCEGMYLYALDYLPVDAVTYNNRWPAFFRWTFELPEEFLWASIQGEANVDDQAVVFLNGHRISGLVGCQTWGDTDPNNPSIDATGTRILTWPTTDPFGIECESESPGVNKCFVEGTNELVFAVSANSSAYNPTGMEFVATIETIVFGDCVNDHDGDGIVDCNDPCPLYSDDFDCNGNGVADGCDIHRDQTSEDCNRNEIPDECEFGGDPEPPPPWDLAVLLDGSGSIAPADFTLITEGLALAVENEEVFPRSGLVTLAVIQFSSGLPGGAVVEVPPTNIDSEATASAVAAQIRAIVQDGQNTPIGDAIDLAVVTILPGRPDARHSITLLTDGVTTSGGDPVLAADNAVAAGIHEIDAIAVGYFDLTELEQIVRPQPNSPGPPPSPGFVTLADSFVEVEQAFDDILNTVMSLLSVATTTVPDAVLGDAYSYTLTANNICGYGDWSLLSGALPEQVGLSTTGELSGTALECGSFTFEVQVEDLSGATANQPLTLNVVHPEDDGDVDVADFARFQVCFSGADTTFVDFLCDCFDTDNDDDIDVNDFTDFVEAITGPQ